MNKIEQLSDREHILKRPAMYVGAIDKVSSVEYIFENNKIIEKEVGVVPALLKIINEIIDNSIDIAIKNDFKFGNEIIVKITDKYVEVKDNGTGIPVVKDKKTDKFLPEIAWGNARAGSNFDDVGRTNIGMNRNRKFRYKLFF